MEEEQEEWAGKMEEDEEGCTDCEMKGELKVEG